MCEIIFSNETIKMFSFLRLVFIQWGKGRDDTGGKAVPLRKGSIFAIDRGLILFLFIHRSLK